MLTLFILIQFDTSHDLLHHYFAPYGCVQAHQVQLPEVRELVHATLFTFCAFQADQFGTPHDLLHHYFAPHGGVRAHQVQLLEVGDLLHVAHLI